MDHSLLRLWLGLAPGSWPPDHYALLGLPPGKCDPAAIESLVLARMDRLREHQLLHPELVTEGMNRLAQALICLTDPVARAAYDASLGLPVLSEEATVRDADLLLDQPPPRVPYEVVEGEQPEPLPLPPAYEVMWEDEESRRPAYEVVEVVEAALVSRPVGPWQPATRRELFARLAAVRRLQAAWQKLKPLLGDPREPLARPARVVALLEAIAEVRPALAPVGDVIGEKGKPGGLVATVIAQPLVLHTFRLLLPDQRRAVAIDWCRGEAALVREYNRLRELVRSGRPLRRSRGGWRVLNWLVQTPEITLIVLVIGTILIALLRGRDVR